MALGGALGPGLVVRDACDARDAAALCIAGVGLGDIHLDFTWQAWHTVRCPPSYRTCNLDALLKS